MLYAIYSVKIALISRYYYFAINFFAGTHFRLNGNLLSFFALFLIDYL